MRQKNTLVMKAMQKIKVQCHRKEMEGTLEISTPKCWKEEEEIGKKGKLLREN